LISAKVANLLDERFPNLAPWKQTVRSWKSIIFNKFKNERNDFGIGSKHVDEKGQVRRNGKTLVEVLNVGAPLAPAGVGGLASDATLQPCSVSAASGRSSCSLGESRKRPRADDDAGGNGEGGVCAQALIACTLEKLKHHHQASARESNSLMYIQYILQARATLGDREKKMPPGKVYLSHVYYRIYKYIFI